MSFDVLEHIKYDSQALKVIANLLKPSGFIFVSVPQHMSLWSDRDVYAGHFEDIQKELLSILSKAGFTVCIHLHLSFCFLLCFFATTFLFQKSTAP